MERQKFINIEKVVVPQILIGEALAIGSLLNIGTTTKIKIKPIIIPPIIPPETPPKIPPKPPVPPTTPPREFPPFEFPNISIMGQPLRGLVPGFGRGIRSMYDIQYALSRLTL